MKELVPLREKNIQDTPTKQDLWKSIPHLMQQHGTPKLQRLQNKSPSLFCNYLYKLFKQNFNQKEKMVITKTDCRLNIQW